MSDGVAATYTVKKFGSNREDLTIKRERRYSAELQIGEKYPVIYRKGPDEDANYELAELKEIGNGSVCILICDERLYLAEEYFRHLIEPFGSESKPEEDLSL